MFVDLRFNWHGGTLYFGPRLELPFVLRHIHSARNALILTQFVPN
jgi:hypothetical protein